MVLTNERIIVAYLNTGLNMTFAQMSNRLPIPRVIQFQGEGYVSSFQIEGLPLQAIALPAATVGRLREILESTPTPESTTTHLVVQVDDPVETLSKLKSMLDMDLVTREEYEAKKTEVMSQM